MKMQPGWLNRSRFRLAGLWTVLAVSCYATISCDAQEKNPKITFGNWQVLHLSTKAPKGTQILKDDGAIKPVKTLELTGPKPGDPFRFGKFAINGQFGYENGSIQRTEGTNAAVSLGTYDDFELEGLIDAEGLGGWFLMIGFKEGHGHQLTNVTMKKSGSVWHLCEYRGGKAIEESDREVNRLNWKGFQPFRVAVVGSKLTLKVSTNTLANEIDLERYHSGELIIGTYETQYGAKPIRIQSLRVRTNKP